MIKNHGELLVLGGGVVGLSCALRLQADGWRTTVADPGSQAAASWGNAGHIALEQVEPLASPVNVRSAFRRQFALGGALDFPLADIGVWAPWALKFLAAADPLRFPVGRRWLGNLLAQAGPAWRRLAADIGAGDLYAETGHLVVWATPQQAEAGRRAWAEAEIGTTRFHPLETEALDALGARLKARPAGGVRFEGSGRIHDLGALKTRLESAFVAAGGVMRTGEAARLALEGGRASVTIPGEAPQSPDLILVCAGARSGRLMQGVGHKVPLIAERGYHLHDPDADWPEALSPLVFEDRSLIVNRFRDGLRCSSFVEFARPQTRPDRRKWARLRRHVAELGLPIGPNAREWMGARPTLPDYLPAIGRSRRASNLAYAFGHQHLGLTLAPITAEAVAAMMGGREPPIPLGPFDLSRFD